MDIVAQVNDVATGPLVTLILTDIASAGVWTQVLLHTIKHPTDQSRGLTHYRHIGSWNAIDLTLPHCSLYV